MALPGMNSGSVLSGGKFISQKWFQYCCYSQALKQLPRDKIQLATKFGVTVLGEGKYGAKGTPEYVRKCCEASLKRLDVGYIDLYYQHRVDLSMPIEDTVSIKRFLFSPLKCFSNSWSIIWTHKTIFEIVMAIYIWLAFCKEDGRAQETGGWRKDKVHWVIRS